MDISANTLISSLFQPKTTTDTSAKSFDMDALAEQFATIEPGASTQTAKIAATNTGISIDDPRVKQIDLDTTPLKHISEAPEEVYNTYIAAEERTLQSKYTQLPDTSQNPRYDQYAQVVVDGKVVAKIDNHGWTGISNAQNGKIGHLPNEANGIISGPALAQARAQHIAEKLGGEVQRADTALTQQQFNAIPPTKTQVDTAALQQDARYEQLQQTKQSRTEFITQQIAQESSAEETTEENTVAQDFLDYMDKTSAELWRERILESLGLTEESLAALPPEDRLAAEEKIERLIREKVEEEAERAEKENGKTKEMTDTEQQQTSHHIGAKNTALNNDLSGLQSSDPKITHMLNLTAETTQAYASAQQKSETLEQTRQEKRERLTEERI